ncbi:2OG-Fe(II) oxygenase [bacterium]|nr:2OG-Fe(II) oxygenase [bacterium]
MQTEKRPPAGTLPGEWIPPAGLTLTSTVPSPVVQRLDIDGRSLALQAHQVLTPQDCDLLVKAMAESKKGCPVDVFGFSDGDTRGIKAAVSQESRGSWRATAWSPELAAQLWKKLDPAIPEQRIIEDDRTATDWHSPSPHRHWVKVGLSPVLRFMRYESGGQHCSHYDASFDYGDGRRTLLSVVFYLTEAEPGAGGCTRFVRDGQEDKPIGQRSFGDWPRLTEPHEVVVAVRPQLGSVLAFDHRLCHDVEQYLGQGPRVIVRGDVVFRPA